MSSGAITEYFWPASRQGSYAGPDGTPGFETFLGEGFNRSGNRVIKNGRGARYRSGPFAGKTQDQALEVGRKMYAGLSDSEKLQWEKRGRMEDVRSGRELAAANPDPGARPGESQMQAQARKTGAWHSGDGKMKQGFDAASPAYKAQLIGIYGGEENARAQFGEKPDGRGGFTGPDGRPVGGRPETASVPGAENYKAPVEMPKFDAAKPGAAFEAPSLVTGDSSIVTGRVGSPAPGSPSTNHESQVTASAPARVGMINGKPAAQAIAEATAEAEAARGGPAPYAGPTSPKPNPTQASAATGAETPGAAIKKGRQPFAV